MQEIKIKEKKKFRISAKTLFLTYPQVDKSIKKEGFLAFISQKLQIQDYVIAIEKHADGNPHIHAYLRLSRKCDIRKPDYLDFNGYHGRYEPVRKR